MPFCVGQNNRSTKMFTGQSLELVSVLPYTAQRNLVAVITLKIMRWRENIVLLICLRCNGRGPSMWRRELGGQRERRCEDSRGQGDET